MNNAEISDRGRTSRIVIALHISFLTLVFSLGFMQPDIRIQGISINVTELLFLITAGIWTLAALRGDSRPRWDKAYWLLGLYAVGLSVSAVFSEKPAASLVKLLGEVYLIGLLVLAFNVVVTLKLLKKIVFAWLAASAVVAFVGPLTVAFFYLGTANLITDFALHHYGTLPPGNYPRIQSTFLYPSMVCSYLTVSLMMLLVTRKLGWLRPSLSAILAVLFVITLAFTFTPGVGGVLIAVAVWYWYVLNERGRLLPSRLSLLAGGLAASSFLAASTFTPITTTTSPYFFHLAGVRIDPTPRLLVWQGALQTFLEHPIFGKGIGLPVANVYFLPPSGTMQLLTDAHNIVLSVAAQAGLVGIVPLLLICIMVIRRSQLLDPGQNDLGTLRLGLGIAFASCFVYQGLVGAFEDARHLWVLMGVVLGLDRVSQVHEGNAAEP